MASVDERDVEQLDEPAHLHEPFPYQLPIRPSTRVTITGVEDCPWHGLYRAESGRCPECVEEMRR